MSNLDDSVWGGSPAQDVQDVFDGKVESWRDRLLDLGNRNALINTRFSERSSTIEFDTPSTEDIWVKLAAESEAGADPMRFPWRRDLVPPPPDWQEYEDERVDGEDDNASSPDSSGGAFDGLPQSRSRRASEKDHEARTGNSSTEHKRKRREWNPPLEECRRSPYLRSHDLLVDKSDRVLDRKLRNLDADARLAMSEQGVHALYVAFGFLKWYESTDSTEERYSPLMLVPVTLSRDSTSAPWELTEAEDDAVDNLCLRQRLWQDFKLELPPLPDINELEEMGAREKFLHKVRIAIEKHERWEVVDKCVLGRFAFPKIAMWKDLGDHRNSVTAHTLCRAIGGDERAISNESFGPISEVPPAKELDDTLPPGEVKTILDCDSSQLEAIVAARKGVSFVLDGPPGTGKSQTIANIIADALSLGRTVLFVSEKISALEVVKQRLEDRQLDDFCLECHSDKANRRAVLFELDRCLSLPAEVYQDTAPKLDELLDQRSRLNRYVRRIHEPREPLGLSAFELFGRVSQLTNRGLAQLTRCKLPKLVEANRTIFDGWMRLLGRATDVELVIMEHDEHPWRGCKQTVRSLSIHDELKHHFGTLSERLDHVSSLYSPIVERGLLAPVTTSNLTETLDACAQALTAPNIPAKWFEAPVQTAAVVLAQLSEESRRLAIVDELSCFVDDVEESFPVEAARAVNAGGDDPTLGAIHGLTIPRSTTVRERLVETTEDIERLNLVTSSLRQLEVTLTDHVQVTGLGDPTRLGGKQTGQLGKATRLAAAAGTARPEWLNAKSGKSIRALAEKALTLIGKNEQLANELGSIIALEQISGLSQAMQDAGEMTVSVSDALNLGLRDKASLETAIAGISKATLLVDDIQAATQQIGEVFGASISDGAIKKPVAPAQQLLEALRQVEEAGQCHGAWRDASVRDRICRTCENAVADLTEAAAIRDSFSGRLSHRAFRESAVTLAARGANYLSTWKRWFGGFGAFRTEVAELYVGEVPKGMAVVEDMVTLQKYHRRVGEVRVEAEGLKSQLSNEFMADEPSSWNGLKAAVMAIDHLVSVWPEVVALIPDGNFTVSPRQLTSAVARLVDAEAEYNHLVAELKFNLPKLTDNDVSLIKETLKDHRLTLKTWDRDWNQCNEFTRQPVMTITELDLLIRAVDKFGQRQAELSAATEKFANLLPEESDPTQAATWQAVQDGVDAAALFSSAGIRLDELQATWCGDGFPSHAEAWSAVGSRLEDTALATQAVVDSAGLETRHFPLSEVIRLVGRATKLLRSDHTYLNGISHVLRDDANISIDELNLFADRVEELRATRPKIEHAKSQLNKLGVDSVTHADLEAATWLAQVVAQRKLDPLSKAVASDDVTRLQVREALTDAKLAFSSDDSKEGWRFLETLFDLNTEVSNGFVISELPLGELADKLKWLISQIQRFDIWLKFASWKRDVVEAGFGTVVDELIERRYAPEHTADVVAVQFYRQLFDRLAETDRELGGFDIDEHERIRERFRFLDQWEVKSSASRIRQYQLGRGDRPSSSFLGAESSELGILQKEIAKKRKHKPLRRLFAEIPTVLQRLKPCIMMSPLSVSTFLDTDDIRFDVVIFDEASQVFPWDALGAIYRGQQLIVAGDDKQLPPTNFFNRADAESDDDDEDIGDYESILSLCKSIGMPNKRLKWHYRSRREPLIAFSNRHFYDGELVTFPSVYDARGDGVRFEHVPDGRWVDRKNQKEAERIVEMIVEHVRTKPNKSLGIIALNQSQQRAIEDALYDFKRQQPEIDALFDGNNYFGEVDERLFIKNLENVQGDERDVIFLSMGYGFNEAGKFSKNFGPINRQNGERRLNVAVTRAREELVFVASVRAADMDLSSSKSEGAHLLKAYLNYADKGVDTLGLAMDEFAAEADSPFEAEVAEALIRRGLEPVPQVGCGGFRIDLALKHPERLGEFCLAVECDGVTYHSSHTARDRDRIRQTILENLGWRIVRIWSTDWIRDPERQIDRVIRAYDASVVASPPTYRPPSDVEDEDELEPLYVEKESSAKPIAQKFDNIDEVPDSVIQTTAVYVLTQAGAMTFDDLVKQTSRELGFRRLGGKIKARIEQILGNDLKAGRLKRLGERVTNGE